VKVAHISIENFKQFKRIEIPVRNNITKEIADQFLLLGDNGTGKTTVLQAVGLCLSMISHRIRRIEEFDWLGWLPGRYGRWGTPRIKMEVHFTKGEIEATREAARRWHDLHQPEGEFREPADSPVVHVKLEGARYSTEGDRDEIYQFGGRAYAAAILRHDPSARDLFDNLPGIFWFDQFRNLATPPDDPEQGETRGTDADEFVTAGRVSYHVGVTRLRERLNKWQLGKLLGQGPPNYQHDWLLELENLFRRVFPGRSFAMPEPMYRGGTPTPSDYYFMLSDGRRTYDIQEMSAGEQSVFPMLYEFVQQQIRNSVVLIDEVDLNLHPPLAQALLQALPAMGPNCQFLLTTHSPAISSLMSPEQIYRLEGGKLCL
jgi:hypothetical protein